jgi:hypothetical protein
MVSAECRIPVGVAILGRQEVSDSRLDPVPRSGFRLDQPTLNHIVAYGLECLKRKALAVHWGTQFGDSIDPHILNSF